MATKCPKRYLRTAKILVISGIFIFFFQLFLAYKYFPSENENVFGHLHAQPSRKAIAGSPSKQKIAKEPAFKLNGENDNIIKVKSIKVQIKPTNSKNKISLRVEELSFTPSCAVKSREAISAINRAKTQKCKELIVNTTCSIQSGQFYANFLPNECSKGEFLHGKQIGCFRDKKNLRLLSSHYGNYENTNNPDICIDICIQGGFPYAGVQYSSECFCGEVAPPAEMRLEDSACNMQCPGDDNKTCGGYFSMNVYETGVAKFSAQVPNSSPESSSSNIRIVFLLTLNGRALRQVKRLINALYSSRHYFYIHVDARQDYLHRELQSLEKEFPNIKLAKQRFATIWGGASLLQMLLSAMTDIIDMQWKWEFVINLSESDFPIKPVEQLEQFLSANIGKNFVKSHGREVQRFIKKQGLDKTFIECETHMWRVGDRKLPHGIVIDGGSDWIALSPEFVSYVTGPKDTLLSGLDTVFRHTLLPAESFFHTALRNSKFCGTYVDNNLHVTNWKRKLGCRCQYKHVVDWCGCSPNDFRLEDWVRIQSTQEKQLFFARKFEPVVSQTIIAKVEQWIGFTDQHQLPNFDAYWQSVYTIDDKVQSHSPIPTHSASIIRLILKNLLSKKCKVIPSDILEVNTYHYFDLYRGNLVLYKSIIDNNIVFLETWYKPKKYFKINKISKLSSSIKIFSVNSDYDQKEQMFRNFGNILGPFSEPSILYSFTLSEQNTIYSNLTLVWLDPLDNVAEVNDVHVDETNLTNSVKPDIKTPLLPGIWRVALMDHNVLIAQTSFFVVPLLLSSSQSIIDRDIESINGGSVMTYKDFSNRNLSHLQAISIDFDEKQTNVTKVFDFQKTNAEHSLWIDDILSQLYDLLDVCIHLDSTSNTSLLQCGEHYFDKCETTKWSSLAPDPKGVIGQLNQNTGHLDRK